MVRDDIVILTQQPEGGWWEGTLVSNGRTGWFPANYVREIGKLTDRIKLIIYLGLYFKKINEFVSWIIRSI